MAIWILLVVLAQFINAGISLVEKFIISSGKVGKSIVMTFYVSLLSSLTVLAFFLDFLPFEFINYWQVPSFSNIHVPTFSIIAISVVSAVSFIGALFMLFDSYKIADVSDVVPVINSVQAVAVLLFSFYILDSSITDNFLWGFLFFGNRNIFCC
ncbi:hypothetical protein N9L18_01230 [Candidatus Pacebacteria bacterium]|nr:hypothetical protein [Candidatus Paceibacterota bacterium]